MNTKDLIGLLAHDPMPAGPTVRKQLAGPLLAAALLCLLMVQLFWKINPELGTMAMTPVFATKMLWLASLLLFSAYGLLRLSRPGMGAGHTFTGLALSMLAMASLGLLQSEQAAPDARLGLWMGNSWQSCSVSILVLSSPVLAALLWALRQLAPTRPGLTGAAAGMMAGSVAATLYSLHCTESTFPFFTAWYGGGIVAAGALGALIGPRLLRW